MKVINYQTKVALLKLKSKLLNTDYKAIKFAEGLISPEEYEPVKQERQQLRAQIKELEKKL